MVAPYFSFVGPIQLTSFVVLLARRHRFLATLLNEDSAKAGFGEWCVHRSRNRQSKNKRPLLQRKTSSAVGSHSAHVALMANMAGGLLPKIEFDFLSRIASQAHEKCTKAREQFYRHMAEHDC